MKCYAINILYLKSILIETITTFNFYRWLDFPPEWCMGVERGGCGSPSEATWPPLIPPTCLMFRWISWSTHVRRPGNYFLLGPWGVIYKGYNFLSILLCLAFRNTNYCNESRNILCPILLIIKSINISTRSDNIFLTRHQTIQFSGISGFARSSRHRSY